MSVAAEEFERAKRALIEAGFTNKRALDLLTMRKCLRDDYARAALAGLLAAYGGDKMPHTVTKMAFIYADECLLRRRPGYKPPEEQQ